MSGVVQMTSGRYLWEAENLDASADPKPNGSAWKRSSQDSLVST
jgi:hypothetical protein